MWLWAQLNEAEKAERPRELETAQRHRSEIDDLQQQAYIVVAYVVTAYVGMVYIVMAL